MPETQTKRKRAGEGGLIRQNRAKYQKIIASKRDDYEDDDASMSDASTRDAEPESSIDSPPSPLPSRFTAVRPPHPTPADHAAAARTNTAYDRDPISIAEFSFMGDQAEEAARQVEKEVAMTSDPNGRLYVSATHGAESSTPMMQDASTGFRDARPSSLLSFNPFANTLPTPAAASHLSASETSRSPSPIPITPKKGRPTIDDSIREYAPVPSEIIGHNVDTGSPVYLSGSKTVPSRARKSRHASASTKGTGGAVDEDSADEDLSNNKVGRSTGKGKAKEKAPRKSTAKAAKTAAAKVPAKKTPATKTPSTKPSTKPTKKPAAVKRQPAPSETKPSESPFTIPTSPPTSTILSAITNAPLTPEHTDQKDETLRKQERRKHRAQREKELVEARKTWQAGGHKMPRNWGLVGLPEDEA
ncbi:hypothetical protein PMZ80_002757 [Knufia obscura]|uniref:Uncharacterized protein n=2 Tax=Knufia TaxID=430999 RepID=A0AAN8I6F1_9EURO|nr:hypothetical protein PMZ80_002757 [Knufia obscura]KAK5951530.1 hypothetical protein OHC33_007586 [Knufia fluminis]